MTIGMPELSDQEDVIEVEFEERENGGTNVFFYQSLVERERRLTTLEYKQKKRNITILLFTD